MFVQYFWLHFIVATIGCFIFQYYIRKNESSTIAKSKEFKQFQYFFLVIYLLVMLSDWLQGPYTYALYASYGFNKEEIALLFIAGYGSSALFGTFVGALADKYGRKKLALTFGVIYALSCYVKIYPSFNILMIGRLLGGIATSLLFSVFESWMVNEHNKRGFDSSWLSNTFGLLTLGNGIIAIVAGFIASSISSTYGYVSPFMLAMIILILATIVILFQWTENYGDKETTFGNLFGNAFTSIKNDPKIGVLGLIQSLFEASMYVFVFMWTPVLEETISEVKDATLGLHGLIFSIYMICLMLGSSLFSILIRTLEPERLLLYTLMIACTNFIIIGTFIKQGYLVFTCFLIFEISVGLYFPTIGTLRSKYIPEESRSAVMNLFRVPLNLLVVGILKWVNLFRNEFVFFVCGLWMFIGLMLHWKTFSNTRYSNDEKEKTLVTPNSPPDNEQ